MNLLDFVKNEPLRARRAIVVLSAAFCICFFALAALGIGGVYTRTSERDRAAGLTAADILSLKEAQDAADTASASVCRALISNRASVFLSESDAHLLTEIIGTCDVRFYGLCDVIESLYAEDAFTAVTFVRSLRSFGDGGEVGTLRQTARVQTPASVSNIIGKGKDYAERAADFIGVRNIFRSEGICAYCANVCLVFDGESRGIVTYAIEGVPKIALLTEKECVITAIEYAEGRHGIQSLSAAESTVENAVCRVLLKRDGESFAVVGVRMDTGETVYYYRMHK